MAHSLRPRRATRSFVQDENAYPGAPIDALKPRDSRVTKPAPVPTKAGLAPRRVLGDISSNTARQQNNNTTTTTKRPPRSRHASSNSISSPPKNNSNRASLRSSVAISNAPVSAELSQPPPIGTRSISHPNFNTTEPSSTLPSHLRTRSEAAIPPGAPRIGSYEDEHLDKQPAPEPITRSSGLVGLGIENMDAVDDDDADVEMAHAQHNVSTVSTVQELSMEDDENSILKSLDPATYESDQLSETTSSSEEDDDWTILDPSVSKKAQEYLAKVKLDFDEELDYWDTTMVAEYSNDIFDYMTNLEGKTMPNPNYMDKQVEIDWDMRATLIDWLLQVHARYHMLPETLWIATNIIDRFLSERPVGRTKLQLVGVTAMFIAAKYEEIMAPSVDEFVYMTQRGYSREEILKGEQIILTTLEFNISTYCSPYTWVRRISKADDYDIQTRTLSKFLMEATLLDSRFLRAKPSLIAAIGMYVARKMLGGEWNDAFVFYSGKTEAELETPASFLLEQLADSDYENKFVYKKYASRRFLKASIFACNYARTNSGSARSSPS